MVCLLGKRTPFALAENYIGESVMSQSVLVRIHPQIGPSVLDYQIYKI